MQTPHHVAHCLPQPYEAEVFALNSPRGLLVAVAVAAAVAVVGRCAKAAPQAGR